MKKLSKFMEGKKTYSSLIVLLIGAFGLSEMITSNDVATIIDALFGLMGTLGVIYGRFMAKTTSK